ncbi:hypothetical protein [Chelativorans xinjiangense]|uniref:hypothetical protein n=1 Tax=Chelativorans xinjiangense TaxID=2681485 RepID=UPI00135828A5|nr:hypothetical protein [Chelativorans xinjiangense]
MRKVILLTSALALLGGSAMAQDFKVSNQNGGPDSYLEHQIKPASDDRIVTSGIGGQTRAGFSAAQGFGPSDDNDLPAPRFQLDNTVPAIAPSDVGNVRTYQGYNAADDFEPS